MFPKESEATCKNSADLEGQKHPNCHLTLGESKPFINYYFINFIQLPTYSVLLVILHITSNLRSFLY